MGKRPAEIELFVGNVGSIQREDTAFYAKRRSASHGNRTRTNSSKSSLRAKSSIHITGPSYYAGAGVGELVSYFRQLCARHGWTDSIRGKGVI